MSAYNRKRSERNNNNKKLTNNWTESTKWLLTQMNSFSIIENNLVA